MIKNDCFAEQRKKVKNQIKSLEKKTTLIEQELEAWGTEKETLEKQIANGTFSSLSQDERNRVYERLSHVQSLLHSGMLDWEKWSQELEELRSKYF